MTRIYCLSTVDLDRVFELDHLPGHDEKIFATGFHEAAGGQGVFVARALAALGAPVTYVGSVGDDLAGAGLIAELSAVPGLSVDIARLPGIATANCAILVDRTGEKAIVLAPIAKELVETLGEGLMPAAGDIVTANFFHPEQIVRVFGRARAAGATTIIDMEATGIGVFGWDAAFSVTDAADITCTNQPTLDAWSKREGLDGPLLVRAERHVPAVKVKAVNTTGAGDTFLAGLAFGLSHGHDLFTAAGLATRVAADFLAHGRVDPARLGL